MSKRTFWLVLLACLISLMLWGASAEQECSAHLRYCDEDRCFLCGDAYSGENFAHNYDDEIWGYDEFSHWRECGACGEYICDNDSHYRNCDEYTCGICGKPYYGENTWHTNGSWFTDETYHWFGCAFCGNESAPSSHWTWCDEDVCAECGVAYADENTAHRSITWEVDEMYHWFSCSVCNMNSEKEEHIRWCNESICFNCEQTYTGGHRWHDFAWQADENEHFLICNFCEYIDNRYVHWRWCNEEVCAECEMPYTGERMDHGQLEWTWDEKYHQSACSACNAVLDMNDHWRFCNADVCAECGGSYTGENTVHGEIEWYDNETHHWFECPVCGDTSIKSVHWRWCDENVCVECQVPYSGDNVDHINVDWAADEVYHWFECLNCDYASKKNSHWRLCDESVCFACAMTYTGDELSHMDVKWSNDETGHWFDCQACGLTAVKTAHWRLCTEGNCFECNASYDGDKVVHANGDIKDIEDNLHVTLCYDCGYSDCYRFCDVEFCAVCSVEYTGKDIKHYEGEWVVIREATAESEGLKEIHCTSCGFLLKTEVIPKLENEEKVIHGDVSGDGVIDGRDLLRLAKYIGGYAVTIDEKSASVNGDSVIDGRDLLRLAKYIGGYNVELK